MADMLVMSEGETGWELAALGNTCRSPKATVLVREKPAYHSDSVQLPESGLPLAVSLSSALRIQIYHTPMQGPDKQGEGQIITVLCWDSTLHISTERQKIKNKK